MHIILCIILIVGNCGDPTLLLPVNNSVPSVESYDDLPIEGSTVRFSCPPGSVLVRSSSATCTENGEWEPDPVDSCVMIQKVRPSLFILCLHSSTCGVEK